ncbi:MAG TPA: aspartate aminotransferase family protein [Terriglobia bacterium]|jgi:acetylornithine/N-succinyldiaminopimelate aminotransferase|nr:aspartate aminotransferase family protein [Terriglobia bacterium]
MSFDDISALEQRTLIPTYERLPILAVRGAGCYLYDDRGKRYLDFFGGLAVNALGYAHPEVLAVLRDEAETLLHVSNLIYHRYQAPLAERLARWAGLDRVFFGNSGTEVTEGAIKLARAYARKNHPAEPFERYEILAVENSFHGRTSGALAATWPEKYRAPFEPLLPGVRFVRLNDVAHLRECFTPRVAALIVETIQGEGGVVKISEEFLKAGEALARAHDALLVSDEIQCGLGRTGMLFEFKRYGLKPDVVVVAKSLAAGLPLGAIIAREGVAQAFSAGLHGTTFGGGPLQCRVALKVLEIIERRGFLEHVREVGAYFQQQLELLRRELAVIREVRGEGLMLAAELSVPCKDVVRQALEAGFILNCTQTKVLRFLPPLVLERRHVDELMAALRPILAGIQEQSLVASG